MSDTEDVPFTVEDTKVVYENPWIIVHEDAIRRKNGEEGIYGYLESGDSVVIIAVNEHDEICIIESYRHPIKRWVWELPGGGDDGEDPVLASQRELQEETGITARTWHVLGKARVSSGLSDEYQINVLARDITVSEVTEPEDEIRACKFVSLAEIDAMIASGEFDDNQSISTLYMYKTWLEQK